METCGAITSRGSRKYAFIDALRRADILASPYFYFFDDGFQRNLTEAQDEAYVRYGMARFGAFANVMPVLANEVELKFTDRNDPSCDTQSFDWARCLTRRTLSPLHRHILSLPLFRIQRLVCDCIAADQGSERRAGSTGAGFVRTTNVCM